MISRRRSREFLLQSLYARANQGSAFDRETFIANYFSGDNRIELDIVFVDRIESVLIDRERELLTIIAALAPKFDLMTMPVLHILIIMIALSEMMYLPDLAIPESVSINEAIELAKRFSDDQGRMFINGALSTFLKKRESVILAEQKTDFRVFAQGIENPS